MALSVVIHNAHRLRNHDAIGRQDRPSAKQKEFETAAPGGSGRGVTTTPSATTDLSAKVEEMSVSQLVRRLLRQYTNGTMPTAPMGQA